jgi:RNA-directed DNA polymerase
MNTPNTKVMYEWKDIPWRKLEVSVFKLQKRIFQATKRGNVKTARRLQRLLMKSRAAALLAVRKVTQENRGKKTAGIDGVKSLEPKQRLALAQNLITQPFPQKVQPVRRIWIPKPGTKEKRPLGIPTMDDRARQAHVKLALEPEWEAKFEPNSFGFRPARSAHDAIRAIKASIKDVPSYVLDADIAKCFDKIDHHALLEKLNTFPTMRRIIKQWLKAKILDGDNLFPAQEGTPQGGVLSPLLANIALHGLENAIAQEFPERLRIHLTAEKATMKKQIRWKPKIVRYADDFVILHRDLNALKQTKAIATAWLRRMGLELSERKTRITHTLRPEFGTPGFDFLGFNIRQYRQGKTHIRKIRTETHAFRTLIKPSSKAKRSHIKDLSETIQSMKACPQEELIARLNPQITGWANYHSIGIYQQLNRMDYVIYHQLRRWALRRHPRHNRSWIARKYWRLETGKWSFGTPDRKTVLVRHARKVPRLYQLRGESSIYDGDWVYWAMRMGKHPSLSPTRAKLLQMQNGKCAYCGLHFKTEDMIEIDHVVPTSRKGRRYSDNLQLLHAHCHDRKTSQDNAAGINNNDRIIEEPDEGKPSRPVLKTSASGD